MSAVVAKKLHALPLPENGGIEQVSPQNMLPWLSKLWAAITPNNWERVTVNKNIDSITMPKWVAICVLGAFLAFMGQSWWARSADHDAMIRIETKLEAATEAANKAEAEQKARNGDMQAWREVMNGNLKEIKGMLSQQQIDSFNRNEKHPN
jgi:hypothetical protein